MLRIFFMKKNKIKNSPDSLNIYITFRVFAADFE